MRLVPFLREAELIEDPPTPEETLKITEGSVAGPRAGRHAR